ncbi:MAG TPA: dockerin type I domain-containing protein [Phycisphaerae bacterium]|nr:dockerin type I domain-containing protein [Phycisphaerae bacterium]
MKMSIRRAGRPLGVLLTGALALTCGVAATAAERQDGRYIPRLRWTSPHGELPGTHAAYLQSHPLQPACFSEAREFAPQTPQAGPRSPGNLPISILVDATLYPSITTGLNQYIADLTAEGSSVFMQTVSGGTPAEIKAWVAARYYAGSIGVVFIGDITAAWAEVSGDSFPCDLFYMDVDGHWEDTDGDGVYEVHEAGSGDEGPELFVARIYAHTLTYDTEANMVNGYLAKAHAYRAGTLTEPWRGLEYVEEDWYDMDVALNLVYGGNVARYDYGYFTTAADYLNQMDLGQHFVQVCVHSYSGGHYFSTRPTESAAYAHVYVKSPTARAARLRLGSDDGIKVWFNGSNVLTRDVYQGWTADQYTAAVTLNQGWNRLLCKVSQGGGSYQFSARITDPSGGTFSDLDYQLSDPNTHGEEAQFIRGWLLNGFHQDIADNFWSYLTTNYLGVNEALVNPSAGQVMGGQTWTASSSTGPYVDLDSYCGGTDYGACYAFVRVNTNAGKSCQLWMGYDDGARVWLNGSVVLYDNRYGGYTPDMTKFNVNLVAGTNRLLVKISEWMGASGFSARFCNADGTPVSGLTYDPAPSAISYIGTWLMNGPYVNPDQGTRLSQDYLGGESGVRPSAGDAAPFGTWQPGVGSGYPFDIGVFYDHGDWVLSQDIQNRDPPVLFYNLFACGPGRFTDADYLAGAYIFNTTYGLITVASAKSGSMLNFQDFTAPLGQGETVGTAYREWFDAQSPFEEWEREWYYGMVLNGDPMLRPSKRGDLNHDGVVNRDDVPLFVSAILGLPLDPSHINLADMNNDGTTDGRDIALFLNRVIGG